MQVKLLNKNQINTNKSSPNFKGCQINFTKQNLRLLAYDSSKESVLWNPKEIKKNINRLWLNIKKIENRYKDDKFKNISFNLEKDIDDAEHMVIANVGHVRNSLDSLSPFAQSSEYETFVLSNGDEFGEAINNHIGTFYN